MKGLSQIIIAGGFLAGFATWYPPGRHEPSIDMLRPVGTVVGLSFWLPGLMLPAIVWAEYPRDIAGYVGHYAVMSIFGCVAGGVIAAFMVGPATYLVGILVLTPLRLLERSLFPAVLGGTTSNARWTEIANALVAIPVVLAAAIASISTICYAGMIFYAGVISLVPIF